MRYLEEMLRIVYHDFQKAFDTVLHKRLMVKLWEQKCIAYYLLRLICERKNPEEYQCKMLLCYSGDRGLELFNSWTLSPVGKKVITNYWKN